MSRKKLIDDVSISEMRKMREQGMSNKEIAASLEVSDVTIYRYIGRQGCRMESGAWSKPVERQAKPVAEVPEKPVVPRLQMRVTSEKLQYTADSGTVIKMAAQYSEETVVVGIGAEKLTVRVADLRELVQALTATTYHVEDVMKREIA